MFIEDKCFWDTGSTYRGTKDTSINNNKCLRWAHQFHIPTSKHPELTGHNYCRNPGEMEDEPFCYVEQDRREPCGINKCGKCANLLICFSLLNEEFTVYVFGVYMMFIVLGIGLFIGAVVSYCYCRRKNRNTRNLQNVSTCLSSINLCSVTENETRRSSGQSNICVYGLYVLFPVPPSICVHTHTRLLISFTPRSVHYS